MASSVGIELTGDKAAIAMLAAIEGKVQKKLVRQALKKSSKRLKKEVERRIATIPLVDTGQYLRAVQGAKLRAGKRSRKRIVMGIEKPTRAELGISPDDKAYYPNALEYGTPTAPAKPHWRPAVDENAKAEFKAIGEDLRRGIEREAAKAKKV